MSWTSGEQKTQSKVGQKWVKRYADDPLASGLWHSLLSVPLYSMCKRDVRERNEEHMHSCTWMLYLQNPRQELRGRERECSTLRPEGHPHTSWFFLLLLLLLLFSQSFLVMKNLPLLTSLSLSCVGGQKRSFFLFHSSFCASSSPASLLHPHLRHYILYCSSTSSFGSLFPFCFLSFSSFSSHFSGQPDFVS